MYLRTQCDRELYLSLFSNNPQSLGEAGIPIPLKSRPGVQILTQSGQEFETEQFDVLLRALPGKVICEPHYRAMDPVKALSQASAPCFILQPAIEPERYRNFVLRNLGLTDEEQVTIPRLSGLRPDVLYVYRPQPGEYEILPNGTRLRIKEGDKRFAISVIDLKNITESNASYSGEVCLYAFFLANWLASEGNAFQGQFFVSDRIYLWKHGEMPEFTKSLGLKGKTSPEARITELLKDLEEGLISYLIYMPSVTKFFKEDVPRVITKGDTEGWQAVQYHVNSKCSSCDWLGNPNWLVGNDLEYYRNNPDHYCMRCAETFDHLSQMASLSRGASQILSDNGHGQIRNLVGIQPDSNVLKRHSILKRDRSHMSYRAQALTNGILSVDGAARVGGLARKLNAEFDIIVNFDSGSGMLTGIAVRGILFAPYREKFTSADGIERGFRFLGEKAFVVPRDNTTAEWTALQGFIEFLAHEISNADQQFQENSWGSVRTQICFWESRQYEELCNAFGRHLLRILNLQQRNERALAWLFPTEELLQRDEHLAPGIVFIKEIIESFVRLPVRFVYTLLSVAEHYHLPSMPPRNVDKYYREPLGNAVPRERILEIWKSITGTINIFGRPASIQDGIERYGNVLKAHTWALSTVVARLRADLRQGLQGNAPILTMTVPQGINSVAYDSKLWAQWDKVSAATAEAEGKLDLITQAERLEASYKAIILTNLMRDLGNFRYEFEVSAESTEAKIEEGDSYCAVGIYSQPGFPLQTGLSLGLTINDPDANAKLNAPMHRVIMATLERFDRLNRRAIVYFQPRSSWVEPVFLACFREGIIPLGNEQIYILDALPYDDSSTTLDILRTMRNPLCATPARESQLAMGNTAARLPRGTDPDLPIARVLWQANVLRAKRVYSDEEVERITAFAETANQHSLNHSQIEAVRACIQNQLSVIWGPPGTGKTDTLVAMLHALIANPDIVRCRKILITGPNYRTVEEIAGRLLENLNKDLNCEADFFWIYSRSREPKTLPEISTHLHARSIRLESNPEDTNALIQSHSNAARITIVATTAHVVHKVTRTISGVGIIQPLFDFVVIDESSQVPVTMALRPLSVLRPEGQLIIAGDHLQMPPIYKLQPPKGAEYLVGSIQTYLVQRFSLPQQELLVNYRSNQDLVDYAKTLGYPVSLTAFNEIKELKQIADFGAILENLPANLPKTDAYRELLTPERRVTCFLHEDVVSSQANEIEAKLVAGLAYCLRHTMSQDLFTGNNHAEFSSFTDESFFKEGLGIVTPHKAQKALVLRELRILFPNVDPEIIFEAVDTVERFQGGQRQTIIVSFGVGDIEIIEGEETFLLQLERTNVAVSRAKAKCIILMPKSLAYHLPTDQKAAETAIALKSYIEEFCRNRKRVDINYNNERRIGEVRWH